MPSVLIPVNRLKGLEQRNILTKMGDWPEEQGGLMQNEREPEKELFLLLPLVVVKRRAQKPEETKQVEWPPEERKPAISLEDLLLGVLKALLAAVL